MPRRNVLLKTAIYIYLQNKKKKQNSWFLKPKLNLFLSLENVFSIQVNPCLKWSCSALFSKIISVITSYGKTPPEKPKPLFTGFCRFFLNLFSGFFLTFLESIYLLFQRFGSVIFLRIRIVKITDPDLDPTQKPKADPGQILTKFKVSKYLSFFLERKILWISFVYQKTH